jgi:hypothetical protein
MARYLEQLNRVRRFLDRISRQHRPPVEYEDDVWSFFQNCWHLKDWVKNDPNVPESVRDSIEEHAGRSGLLKTCRDLATRMKHLEVWYERVGAKPLHYNVTIVPGGSSKVEYLVDPGNETKQDGLDLARECLLEWERILGSLGLKVK